MLTWLGTWAGAWFLTASVGTFLLLAFLEARAPLRPAPGVALRWATNFGLYALALLLTAQVAPERLAGAFTTWQGALLPPLARAGGDAAVLIAGFALLDLLAYWEHRLQHLGPFWRLHHVHHADREMDASTAVRHHPGEFLFNAALGAVAMAGLGVPVWVVPIYALIAQLADLGQHANLALPPWLDRRLAVVVMTPGVHRIHHSEAAEHYDTNFGAVLTIWDRVFGTWHPQTSAALRLGVAGVGAQGPVRALAAPFRPVR